MSECDEQLLGAYHDGELGATERARVEQHLAQCADCTAELDRLRQASKVLGEYPFQDITTDELSRLHRAIDDEANEEQEAQVVWRIGGTMGLIAASILVVGFAWLRSMPTATPIGGQPNQMEMAAGSAPLWERMAVTGQPGPVNLNTDDVQTAMEMEADYMADQLKPGRIDR